VAFATGLRVIERSETVAELLDFLEFRLIGLMSRIVRDAVALIVESGGRFR
jgi:predicted subunit of tRNA(5-methylaminomethyl-2-thiouridylate) methyltransferase